MVNDRYELCSRSAFVRARTWLWLMGTILVGSAAFLYWSAWAFKVGMWPGFCPIQMCSSFLTTFAFCVLTPSRICPIAFAWFSHP
jgi:hypothetical protein